jgi:hypothetical protein
MLSSSAGFVVIATKGLSLDDPDSRFLRELKYLLFPAQ